MPLQLDTLTSPRANSRDQRASSRLLAWAIRGADKVSQLRPRRKIKTDVLFCPNAVFQPENRKSISCPHSSRACANGCQNSLFAASRCPLPG